MMGMHRFSIGDEVKPRHQTTPAAKYVVYERWSQECPSGVQLFYDCRPYRDDSHQILSRLSRFGRGAEDPPHVPEWDAAHIATPAGGLQALVRFREDELVAWSDVHG